MSTDKKIVYFPSQNAENGNKIATSENLDSSYFKDRKFYIMTSKTLVKFVKK